MSLQKSILSFVKRDVTPKRSPLLESVNNSFKRFKNDSVAEENKSMSNDSPKPFSDVSNKSDGDGERLCGDPAATYDKKLIEEKRLKAKLKLASKNFSIVDPEMGVTWVAAVENEFSKPYFKKVRSVLMPFFK